MKYICPNCGLEFDSKVEKEPEFIPNTHDYINADKTGATCWRCNYSSEFRDESWNKGIKESEHMTKREKCENCGADLNNERCCPNCGQCSTCK